VIEVREETASVCAIRRTVDADWPLKVGDKIYNDLYEGGRIRHIAIAGRFSGRLSNEEAGHLVRKQGDVFQEKVDEKTNYVVVADGYEEHPNYKAALEYGIKILREPILYDYLGVPRK
jgi:NAD-dependent DNA ligase